MLEEFKVNIRVKLAALWSAVTLCYLYGDYFELYVPNKTAGLLNGQNLLDSPAKLLLAAVMLAIPALMVYFSVVLKARWCQILNIAFGVFFTAIMVLIAVTSLTAWRAFYVFLAVVESILTTNIAVLAWQWPKQTKAGS